jgi:stage II sporulation protein AA (anti-sigma F factor antagonist)
LGDRIKQKVKKEEVMIKDNGSYESVIDGEALTVLIKGEIDHHNAVRIRQSIDAEIFSQRPKKVIFELSRVDFMDSSGLGLILGRFASVREVGGELIVKNPTKNVMKILKLAGAERIIRIENGKIS